MNTKQKILFAVIDLVLVGLVFLILGLCVGFNNMVNVACIVLLGLTLLLPIPLAFFCKNTAVAVGTILLIIANIIISIVFMTMSKTLNPRVVGITEGGILGAYLLFALIALFVSSYNTNEENKQ